MPARGEGELELRVLGTVEAGPPGGTAVPLGDRQRALLASLVARAGEVVPADRLADLLWADGDAPVDPIGALQSQVSRLRRALPDVAIVTRPPGYALQADRGAVDALRFDALVARARTAPAGAAADLLAEALRLWRGPAYAEFAETPIARFEAIRLEEARREATEAWHLSMLDAGRVGESLPRLEAFVREHPLRERARDVLMRTLYALGRHADALATYAEYEARLGDELGLEPAASLQRLRLDVLRQELAAGPAAVPEGAASLSAMRARYLDVGGHAIAVATVGDGPSLVALPGWVTSIDVIASGRDPRSSLLQRLAGRVRLTIFDRYGTGLSRGAVEDFGLAHSVAELAEVVRQSSPPVSLLAMSQAGPVAVALAAGHPDLVERLVFLGTYASARTVFTRPDLNAALVAIVRSHWGLGSKTFAELFRPDASDEAAHHLAMVLHDSADREVAAGYLEAVYEADAADLLARVTAPALVLHYRGDRVVPFTGARQLAAGLPDARLIPLDGRFHLPDAADLDAVVAAIDEFLPRPAASRSPR